jgi:transcription antitermination protein NusB
MQKVDPRHQARKLALFKLYTEFFGGTGDIPDELVFDMPHTVQADLALVKDLVDGVKADITKIDGIITTCAPEWPLDRIAKIDLAILRIAVYEIVNAKVNASVAINEAVELAKEFGGENSSKFVNGVLGSVATPRAEDHEKQQL